MTILCIVEYNLSFSLKRIGNAKTPLDIDIGVGDVVIPKPKKRKLEVLLPDFNNPDLLTYSLESTIAEKRDAIIDRMEFNKNNLDKLLIKTISKK